MFKAPSAIAHHIESGCHKINRHQVTAAVKKLKIVPEICITPRLLPSSDPHTNKVSNNNHYAKPAYISLAWNAIYPPTTGIICNNSLLRKCEMGG